MTKPSSLITVVGLGIAWLALCGQAHAGLINHWQFDEVDKMPPACPGEIDRQQTIAPPGQAWAVVVATCVEPRTGAPSKSITQVKRNRRFR